LRHKNRALKADLHIHSNFSDGNLSISEIVDLYGKSGFDTIAITDHLAESKNLIGKVSHQMKYSLNEKTFPQYRIEIQKQKKRAAEQYGLNIIFGYEITKNYFSNTRSCHVLILGVEEYISPDLEIEEIMAIAKSKGGLIIAAHPFHTGDFEFQTFYLWSRREQLKHTIDAWEMSYRNKVSPDVMKSGLPLIASSDFHNINHLSSWKTHLYCENNFVDIQTAIRNQNLDFFYFQFRTANQNPDLSLNKS
jgi:PHP family Zn ribbon phosphoesterase